MSYDIEIKATNRETGRVEVARIRCVGIGFEEEVGMDAIANRVVESCSFVMVRPLLRPGEAGLYTVETLDFGKDFPRAHDR